MSVLGPHYISWNSTGEIGRIGRHLTEKPNVKVMMCFGPMPPDASDFPGRIPALKPITGGALFSYIAVSGEQSNALAALNAGKFVCSLKCVIQNVVS